MERVPFVRRIAAWGFWGAAIGVALGFIVGRFLAEAQRCTHLCEGNGLQVPIGMFFGFWLGLVIGMVTRSLVAAWTRRRSARRP
jgi:hypothetical protein